MLLPVYYYAFFCNLEQRMISQSKMSYFWCFSVGPSSGFGFSCPALIRQITGNLDPGWSESSTKYGNQIEPVD